MDTRTRIRGRRAGLTLVELVIAASLLTFVLGSVVAALDQSSRSFRRSAAAGAVEVRSSRTMERLRAHLSGAIQVSLAPPPDPLLGSDSLTFNEAVDYVGGVVQWGPTVRLALEPAPGELDNGRDDNADGLVDEGVLVRIEDPGGPGERRFLLVRGVAEYLTGELPNGLDDNGNGLIDERGLSFQVEGSLLHVRLTVQLGAEGSEVLERTLESTLALRN